ncbi:MAG: hypothetical protein ACFS26_00080 [Candidatus Karelsulcia muelleri]
MKTEALALNLRNWILQRFESAFYEKNYKRLLDGMSESSSKKALKYGGKGKWVWLKKCK